ncbi:MAG: hypothetical protein RIR00_362 [Pseudomonadota bacterium]|jgi:uncharacterized membrane protein SirB2
MYLLLKHLHVSCVVLSGLGFLLRGIWMWREDARLQQRWIRIAPHVIDSLLLGSAITMAVLSQQYPLRETWLTLKLLGLLAYIQFGRWALRPDLPPTRRRASFLAALGCYLLIVTVALGRVQLGLLG